MWNRFSFYFWEKRNVNLVIHPLHHFCYGAQICQSIFICSKISHNMNVRYKTVSIDKTHFSFNLWDKMMLFTASSWRKTINETQPIVKNTVSSKVKLIMICNTKPFYGIESLSRRQRLTDKWKLWKSSSIFTDWMVSTTKLLFCWPYDDVL